MNITVRIERLVLDGINMSDAERPLLQRAVEAELAHLLAEDGLAPRLAGTGAMRQLAGGTVHLTREPNPDNLGRQIAQAVYGGLSL